MKTILFNSENYTDEYSNDMTQIDYEWLDDMLSNINVPGKLIAIGTIKRWNGVIYGSSPCIKGEDYRNTQYADDILRYIQDGNYDEFEIYIEKGNIKAICHHHDGTNYFTFRYMKDDEKMNNMWAKRLTPKRVSYYTRSLVPLLKNFLSQ